MTARPAQLKPTDPGALESRPRAAQDSEPCGDAELVTLLREDPARGARELVERYSADVNRLVWRLLGADPDHNDLVQHVFLRALAQVCTLRDPGRLGSWIQSVAVNTVYEELRRRQVRRLLLRVYQPPRVHADLVQEVEARDLLLAAKLVVSKLRAKEQIVFMLHFVEGRTLPEIAELCGFSQTTAKRRLRAASTHFQRLAAAYPELSRRFAGSAAQGDST
jgi:RNA polymerase sigma-70 factor (ECF subfamily)